LNGGDKLEKSLKKDAQRVDIAVGDVAALLDTIRNAKENAVELIADFSEKQKFYEDQKKRLSDVVKFCTKILS